MIPPRVKIFVEPFVIFVAFTLVFWIFRTPAYNYDGYTYFLQGYAPLESLNPHHLAWIPVQAVLDRAAGALRIHPLTLGSLLGAILSALSLSVLSLLFIHLKTSRPLRWALVVFWGLSPQCWFLALQNEPYPAFFLFTISGIAMLWRWSETGNRWWLTFSAVSLGLSVQFQQAALLMAFPAAAFVAWRGAKRSHAFGAVSGWFLTGSATVAIPYITAARMIDVSGPGEFLRWVTDYLESQHGLQVGWADLPKAAYGWTAALLQSQPVVRLIETTWSKRGAWFLGWALAVFWAIALFHFYRRNYRPDAHAWPLVMGVAGAWALFAFLWEPVTPYYWCLEIPLLSLCLAMRFSRIRRSFLVMVWCANATNLVGNVLVDHRNAARFPEPWIRSLRTALAPHDRIYSLNRARYELADYDLIFSALESRGDQRGGSLLSDFVSRAPKSWRKDLTAAIDHTRASGGSIYISGAVFEPRWFRDLSNTRNPLALYPAPTFIGIDGLALQRELLNVLQVYRPVPSGLSIAGDRLWKISPGSEK